MALTDKHLVVERPHLGGVQRVYRFNDGHGLSLVNAPMLHSYPFAWEAAVINGVAETGASFRIVYDTPLSNDVEVFQSDDEANEFIERAAELFNAAQEAA